MINKIKIKGVSLITLVVIIVLMLILATATILILDSNNIINSGKETVFKQDISHFVENLEVYHNAKYLESNSSYKSKLLNSDYDSIYYNNIQQQGNIYDILTNLKDSKYDGIVYIQKGEIVLDGFALTNKERAWAEELRVVVNGKPIIKNVIFEITETEIDVEVNPAESSQIIKYKYRLDDGQWAETKNNSYKFTDLQSATKYKVDIVIVSEENYESDIYTKYVYTRGKESDLLITPEKTEFVASDLKIEIAYLGGIPESYVLEYKIGEEEWNSYNTELGITLNENSTVSARIYNKLLDDELVATSKYIGNIDTEAPTNPTDIEITPGTNILSVKAIGSTDELSGIKGYKYSIDNGENWTEIKPEGTSYTFTGIKSGTQKTILAKAIDNVLRESESMSKNGSTNAISGTVTISSSTSWVSTDLSVTAVWTNNLPSGYVVQYKLSGGMTKGWTDATLENGGRETITVTNNKTTVSARLYNKSVDDNVALSSKEIENIDKGKPSIPTTLTLSQSYNSITATASGSTDTDGFGNIGSGIQKYQYSLNGTSGWQDSGTFTGIKSGTAVIVYARAVDNAGNVSDPKPSNSVSTNSLGAVTITPSTTSWTKSNVTVTLTHAAVSGYTLQYKLGTGAWTNYSSAITVSSNTTVSARMYNSSLDDEGNSAASKSITNIDKTAPTNPPSITYTATYTSITATASGSTDVGSGVDKYQYSLDGTNWQNTGTFTGLTNGVTKPIYAKAVDKAGNESGFTKGSVTTTALSTPTISVNTTAWAKSVTVTITGSVPSGYQLQYKLNSGTWTKYSSALTITTNNTTVNARIVNTSNSSDYSATASRKITNIDNVAPTETSSQITMNRNSITYTVTCTDSSSGIKGYSFSSDGGATWTAISSTNSITVKPSSGKEIWLKDLHVKVTDNVGNVYTTTTGPTTARYINKTATNTPYYYYKSSSDSLTKLNVYSTNNVISMHGLGLYKSIYYFVANRTYNNYSPIYFKAADFE